MYFASRVQAGRMLAAQLVKKYRYENCALLALNDGGAVVGAQIAAQLHCVLTLLPAPEITFPTESQAPAGVTADGYVAFNSHSYTQNKVTEMISDNYSLIEQEKLRRMRETHHLVGSLGTVGKELLKGHTVIVVADGLETGFAFDLAVEFLKPIAIDKLVAAIPLASLPAVDRLHVLADDLYCLDAIEDYADTDHYYEKQDVPDHATVLKTIEHIILNWR
jgi:putative phosphoribosyl transferase